MGITKSAAKNASTGTASVRASTEQATSPVLRKPSVKLLSGHIRPCRGERPPVRKAGRQITVKAPGQIQAGSGPPRTGETPHQTVGHPPL